MNARTTRRSKASCNSCAVSWRPLRRSRYLVLVSGWILLLAGFSLIIQADLGAWIRALTAIAWLAEGGRSLGIQARAYRRWWRIEVRADGSGVAVGRGSRLSLRLREGSLIIGRIAWLRFEDAHGRCFGELVLAPDAGADGWRRLNLIMRNGFTR